MHVMFWQILVVGKLLSDGKLLADGKVVITDRMA